LRGKKIKLPSPLLEKKDYNTVRDVLRFGEAGSIIQTDAPEIYSIFKGGAKLAALLCDRSSISNHVITDTGILPRKGLKPWPRRNFHDLDVSLKTTYSLPERTQNTIYLRLQYDEPLEL
jgi:DNA (cytosine-5)-methyltransferase 1